MKKRTVRQICLDAMAQNKVNPHYLLFLFAFLYGSAVSQQTFTFTTAGATGANGPTQVQINNAYTATNLSGSVVSTFGIQSFTVPITALYRLDIAAASGGTPTSYVNNYGGLGARMIGEFNLSAGDVLQILVGQTGGASGGAGAGGGGTYVLNGNALLIAAGGGGGGTSDNMAANGTTATAGTNDYPGGSTPGGVNGNGGQACNVGGAGANHGGGGGGFLTDGATSTANSPGGGGLSFLNGGTGGAGAGIGGFGGGGGCTSITVGGGGGGGYSGGAGGQQVNYCTPGINRSGGGGGGSYNGGINQVNTGGVNSGDGIVVLKELCNVGIVSNANPICIGAVATLSTNAITTLSWSTIGASGASSITVSPTVTTAFSVTGTGSNNCVSTAVITLTVMPLPSIFAAVVPTLLCVGKSATLTGFGTNTYSWGPNSTGTSVAVSPAVSTVYTFTGTNASTGCKNTATVLVNVSTNSLSVSGTTVGCSGSAFNLSAGSAVSYTWSTGSPFSTITEYPVTSTIYSVMAKDANDCTLSNTLQVTVNPLPNVSISADKTIICKNDPVTLTASGASTYSWNNAESGAVITVIMPIDVPYTYSVVGIGTNGCAKSAVITFHVNKCVGIDEQNLNQPVQRLYPNPGNGIVYVEFTEAGPKQMALLDLSGRLLLTRTFEGLRTEVDLSPFVPGVYYLKVNTGNGFNISKLVKH